MLRSKLPYISVEQLMDEIIEDTGYVAELDAEGTDEARARIENIDELISKIVAYEESVEQPTLSGFLEEVALIADIDNLEEDSDYVVLMTLHSAKGLEFPNVYLAGMEDGLFPSYMTITSDDPTESGRRETSVLCGNYKSQRTSDPDQRTDAYDQGRDTVSQSLPFCERNPEESVERHGAGGTTKKRRTDQRFGECKAEFQSETIRRRFLCTGRGYALL